MVSVLQNIFHQFWNQDLWLPENVTWEDITPERNPKISYINYNRLFFAIPLTFLILGLRYFLQRFCFALLGTQFGITNHKRKAPPNHFLENSYSLHKKLTREEILGLAKQLDWAERNVERWLRIRKNQDKTSTLDKFCESAWRVCYYLCFFIIGVMVLWNKRWLWDINECWYGYPYHHHLDKDVYWYFIISLSFYCSLCISQFSDVKRKDFWQMFSHHTISVIAMLLSWVTNLLRFTSLTLFVHEFADILLDLAKLIKYLGYQKLCEAVFIIFTVVWMVTRLGIYPFWIIRSAIWDSVEIGPATYYILNGVLFFIFVLDIFWTYFLLKIIYKFWKVGHVEGDARSTDSENSDE